MSCDVEDMVMSESRVEAVAVESIWERRGVVEIAFMVAIIALPALFRLL